MIIEGNSIAECWIKILHELVNHPGKEASPLLIRINITDAYPEYQDDLEIDINHFLQELNQPEIESTASTIFPISLTNGKLSIFDRYDRIWGKIKKERKNYRGTYFRRLMAYGEKNGEPINQLQQIIDTYNSDIHRRSALIATTFDPLLDHKATKQLGFPCLQQVCFLPISSSKSLSMNAVYAMQYIDIRAYGNYLGLIRLGLFMAEKMNLKFTHINCMLSIAAMGKMTKVKAKEIVTKYSSKVVF